MNLQAIYVANITGFLLILSLLISQYITFKNNSRADHIFSAMMYLVLTSCLIEALTFYVDGRSGILCRWINLIGSTYLYASNVVGSFLFCIYVDINLYHSWERIRKIYNRLALIVILLLISLLLNLKFGYYFSLDSNNVYHRGPLISLFYIYVVICSAFSVVVLYIHRRRYGKREFFPIYMYLIPIIIGSMLQMFIYGISLAWLGTAIGVVALYMSILNQSSFLDALTGLYNRLFLTHSMRRMQKKTSVDYYGIMLDMDRFKSINDTYGHSAGDQALKDAANIFKKVTMKTSTAVFRYAGDEFIILMRTPNEEDVIKLENRLNEEAENFNNTSVRPYKIRFSMGHAHYDHNSDTIDSFLKKIDEAMYANKTSRR